MHISRNTALHPRNRYLVVNFSALKSWDGVYMIECTEGDLGEGMCNGEVGGPCASEIYLLFPVMQIDEKRPKVGSWWMVRIACSIWMERL